VGIVCPLTWQIDTGMQSTFVAVHGRPDASSVLALRAVVERHLARRPDCLLIDVTDMPPTDRVAVAGTALAGEHSSIVSGATILLCDESPGERPRQRNRCERQATLRRLFAQAREALAVGLLRSPSFVEQVLPVSGAARHSRDVVTHACLAWRLTPLTGPAALIASELVSRTIHQASTIMTLVALLDQGVLYLWVRGGSTPVPDPPDEQTAGLQTVVIDALADHWGVLNDGHDTVIWAALPAHTAAR
jgi:hypothetical protein